MDRRLVLAALLALSVVAPARADERTFGLDALRGLRNVSVLVDGLSIDAERDGVRRGTLQADAELRLRRAGIRVVTQRGAPEPQSAVLHVRLDDMKRDLDSGTYHEFRLTLEVLQTVQLTRDPTVQSLQPAWSRTLGGTHLAATVVPAVRDALRQAMEHLIDDFLAANGGVVGRAITLEAPLPKRPEGD